MVPLHQLEPSRTDYHITEATSLRGRLDVPALQRALQELEARHEVLRTTFSQVEGEPVQIIHPRSNSALEMVDLADLSPEQYSLHVAALIQMHQEAKFDLEKGPLWRCLLVKRTETEHVFILTLHHIITDGWSMELIRDELASSYEAILQGTYQRDAQPGVQYADFAVWQRTWLERPAMVRQIEYWRELLGTGELARLDLRRESTMPEQDDQVGRLLEIDVPPVR